MFANIQTIGYREKEHSLSLIYDHSIQAPSFRFHHHSSFEFYVFLEGKVKLCVEDVLYDVAPNSLLIYPPHTLHGLLSLDERAEYERMYFHVTPAFLERMSTENYSLPQVLRQIQQDGRLYYQLEGDDSQTLFGLVRQMSEQTRKPNHPLFEMRRDNLLSQAMLIFMNRIEQQKDVRPSVFYQSHPFLSTALRYINDHYREEISLDDIARQVKVSKYHLCHEFKRLTNNSMMSYIISRRLQFAQNLLKTGMPPLEACFQSGFGSYSNFQKSFRAYYGVSPRDYRSLDVPAKAEAFAPSAGQNKKERT